MGADEVIGDGRVEGVEGAEGAGAGGEPPQAERRGTKAARKTRKRGDVRTDAGISHERFGWKVFSGYAAKLPTTF
jgi:hypothetical protein